MIWSSPEPRPSRTAVRYSIGARRFWTSQSVQFYLPPGTRLSSWSSSSFLDFLPNQPLKNPPCFWAFFTFCPERTTCRGIHSQTRPRYMYTLRIGSDYLHVGLLSGQSDAEDIQNLLQVLWTERTRTRVKTRPEKSPTAPDCGDFPQSGSPRVLPDNSAVVDLVAQRDYRESRDLNQLCDLLVPDHTTAHNPLEMCIVSFTLLHIFDQA